MRVVFQIVSVLFSIVLIILSVLVLPAAEGIVKALAIVGIMTAVLCIIAVIGWWIAYINYESEAEHNRLWRITSK